MIGQVAMSFLYAAAALFSSSTLWAMQPLSDEDMTAVTGRDGVAFEWDLRINADEWGAPLPALSNVEKRLAIKLANRDFEPQGGEWIVWKGFTGRIFFPTFNLTGGTSPFFDSDFADPNRFISAAGFPADPKGSPSLLITFPDVVELWNITIAGISIEYGDVPSFIADPANPPNVGFLADPNDLRSFAGLKIGNSFPDQPGTLSIEGTLALFAF